MRGTVERLQSLEREAGRLERRVDVAKATWLPKRARNCARAAPN